MAFKKVVAANNATVVKFENIGDVIEGYYLGSFDHVGDYGPTKKHLFQTKTGTVVVFGQKNLTDELPKFPVGSSLRVIYTSSLAPTKKGRHPMKLFEFEKDDTDNMDMTSVDVSTTEEPQFSDEGAETSGEAETPPDEVPPARPQAPAAPARAPSLQAQQNVKNTLANKGQRRPLGA